MSRPKKSTRNRKRKETMESMPRKSKVKMKSMLRNMMRKATTKRAMLHRTKPLKSLRKQRARRWALLRNGASGVVGSSLSVTRLTLTTSTTTPCTLEAVVGNLCG